LITTHAIERVILLFHGPAQDGPDDAQCGDYVRKLPGLSKAEIRSRQEEDAAEIERKGLGVAVTLEFYRCEVSGSGKVVFVRLRNAGPQ
jgi:hypothetical protein